jgi:integrase
VSEIKKGTNAITRLLTCKELRKIKKCVKSQYAKDLLDFEDWTGMRAGEIIKLRWGMVDLAIYIIVDDKGWLDAINKLEVYRKTKELLL